MASDDSTVARLAGAADKGPTMLKNLRITRFKSIRELTLDFGAVNLFIGGNGSGKSNILEAIGLVSACLGRGISDADIGMKGLRVTPPELMKSSFKSESLPKTLEFHAAFTDDINYCSVLQSRENDPLLRFFSEASDLGGIPIFGRSNRGARATGVSHADRLDKARGIYDQIKATYEIPDAMVNEFSEFSRFVIYSPQTDFLRGRQSGLVATPPVGLHGEGLPEAVASYLATWGALGKNARNTKSESLEWQIVQKCVSLVWLPGWASQFGAHRPAPNLTTTDVADRSKDVVYFIDRFMHSKRNRLSVYDSSEGTLFLLFIAIALSHPSSPRIFALDNVDNALNPKLTRQLVETIAAVTSLTSSRTPALGAKQVFMTSHNPTALDAFDLFDERQRIFVVRRNDKGHTTAERLRPPPGYTREDWSKATNGRNLSQIWLDGHIPGALGEL